MRLREQRDEGEMVPQAITHPYGRDAQQEGDLYLPARQSLATLVLFHGGFWRLPYDRTQLDALAVSLAQAGFVVWNVGYRRTGWLGGGFPGTLDDALAAVNYVVDLHDQHPQVDPSRVYLVGHSAGGQLALWAASRSQAPGPTLAIKPRAVLALAPITDLIEAYLDPERRESVLAFMNGVRPTVAPENYWWASPLERLPLRCRQVVFHGSADEDIPLEESMRYVAAAQAAGDHADLVELAGGDHMGFLDPESAATSSWVDWILAHEE